MHLRKRNIITEINLLDINPIDLADIKKERGLGQRSFFVFI